MIKTASKQRDLLNGPILKTLILYSIPLIITNIVQILFHAADVAVLGIMAGDAEVAAVGACGSISTLLVSLFTGFATGANVLMAHRVGAKDVDGARRAVGTSLVIALLSGILLMIVALIGARQFLILMNCQEDVLDMAATYMRIYFLGMPVLMLYNFVAGILRSVGDSVHPMNYMLISGALNVVLNVIFIVVFHMTVEGVALATVLSKAVALVLAIRAMLSNGEYCTVERKNLRIGKTELFEIVRVGIPTCLCSIFFYAANVVISSAVNSMSTDAMTANAISGQFDGVVYQIGCSIATACMVMVGQAKGAGKIDRINRVMLSSVGYATAASLGIGVVFLMLSEPLLSIMTDSNSVIAIAKERMTVLCLTYFATSIMEIFSFSLRSLNMAKSSIIVGAICGLGMRAMWVFTVWPLYPTLGMLYICFLPSAVVAVAIYLGFYRVAMKRLRNGV